MVRLRRDGTGTVYTNSSGAPLTVTQVDVDEQDQDIARLCEIARRHLASKSKAMDAILQAEPKLPEKDAYWLADYVIRTESV
jgi:hypothetical protein